MEVKQISELLNAVVKQAYGEEAPTITDYTGIVAMGNYVLNSTTSTDVFLNTLVDRIGYTIFDSRAYRGRNWDIIRHAFEYGCILQKIHVQPMEAVDAPQWDLKADEFVNQYLITKPTVNQKLFNGLTVWEVDVTIPDNTLKTAFTSFETMAAFIDAIFLAISNSLEVELERYGAIAVNNFIAEKIHAQKTGVQGIHCINLLEEYKKEMSGGSAPMITAAEALHNLEFLKWATRQINLYVDRFTTMSKLFNVEGFARFTPREYVRVKMLADFTTAAAYYLQSDTFHNDLVTLPNYTEIGFWQGSGENYSFADTSKINVVTSEGNTVNQDGVVAFISDIEAIGMMYEDRRIRSVRNERGEYTNYFNKADIRYYNDLSENGLVFVISDNSVNPVALSATTAKKVSAAK